MMKKGSGWNGWQAVINGLTLVLLNLWWVGTVSAADRVEYYHTDALGSVVAATNESGAVLWREAYQPFGERIDNEVSSKDNTPFYTGKPHDDDTGLSYFGARYYDPYVGRFLGIDPVGVDPNNLHSFNRYAYANNSPYRFVDKDGRIPLDTVWDAANIIYDLVTGDKEALALDTAALFVPYLPAGITKVSKLGDAADVTKRIGGPDGGFSADLTKTAAKSRSGHRNAGNKQLHDAMSSDPQLRANIEKKFGNDAFNRTSTSGGGRRNPAGAEWDHNSSNSNQLDLRSKANHRQKTSAEGQSGGGWKRFHRD